jgi:glutamine cyclotransferase
MVASGFFKRLRFCGAVLCGLCAFACKGPKFQPSFSSSLVALPAASTAAPSAAPRDSETVIYRQAKANAQLAHSPTAFTQGLAFWRGRLFEGTGLYGRSMLRELDPRSGAEIRHVDVGRQYFGEGITVLDGRIYELTWRENRCLVYDVDTFRKLEEIPYDGEGWGLTNDGTHLVSSDGSSTIRFRDRKTLAVVRTISVVHAGKAVDRLNELEFVNGYIWANVWLTDSIIRIASNSGHVVEVLDLSTVLPRQLCSGNPDDVLNGIAFDESSGRLLITGKRWPLMFEISAK